MVAKLRDKPGGDRIPVTLGTFAEFDLGARFRLVFVAFNTLFALRTHLMARVAGLRLRDRWSDWDRSSFDTTRPSTSP
jgi:hypothetical protein